jgi:hypothetical protein
MATDDRFNHNTQLLARFSQTLAAAADIAQR